MENILQFADIFTSQSYIFVDIFTSRPYIFANTALRRIRKSCWAAWVNGPGRDLHAEYTFMMAEIDFSVKCFRWDKVILTKDPSASSQDHDIFTLENDQVSYCVDRKYLSECKVYDYYLAKRDKIKRIEITLFLACYTYTDNTKHAIDHPVIPPYLQVVYNDSLMIYFSQFMDVFYLSQQPIRAPPGNFAGWMQITNHNIQKVIDFMKTSRLDIGANLPKYTLVK